MVSKGRLKFPKFATNLAFNYVVVNQIMNFKLSWGSFVSFDVVGLIILSLQSEKHFSTRQGLLCEFISEM